MSLFFYVLWTGALGDSGITDWEGVVVYLTPFEFFSKHDYYILFSPVTDLLIKGETLTQKPELINR